MSFLAVLQDEEGTGDFRVPLCHINLWSLGALGPRRTLVLDVGLAIQAGETAVTSVTIALPVGTGDQVEDLAPKVLDTEIAGLIFDNEVTKPAPATIRFDEADMPVARIKTTSSTQAEAHRSRDFSVWTLQLTAPIKAGQSAYLRARFCVTGSGRTWQWQRQYLARVGAVVDFRVCDFRGTATVKGGDELRGRILPIDRVNVFVMVPSWLHQRSVSPAPHYVRLLEGSVWAGYLGRSPEIRSRSKLVVYYWRNNGPSPSTLPQAAAGGPAVDDHGVGTQTGVGVAPEAGSVSRDDPLRVFIDLALQPGPGSPLAVLKILTTTIAAALILFRVPIKPGWSTFARDTGNWLSHLPTWLGFSTGATVILFLVTRRFDAFKTFWSALYRHLLGAEAALFRKLPK